MNRAFSLKFEIRNGGFEATPAVSHIYLFGKKNSSVFPCTYEEVEELFPQWLPAFTYQGKTEPVKVKKLVPKSLNPFDAAPIDSEDGLVNQYRLDCTMPSVPAGAVEGINVSFMVNEMATNLQSALRLRIHTALRYYDFPFAIRLRLY